MLREKELHILETLTRARGGKVQLHALLNALPEPPLEVKAILRHLDRDGYIAPHYGSADEYIQITTEGRALLNNAGGALLTENRSTLWPLYSPIASLGSTRRRANPMPRILSLITTLGIIVVLVLLYLSLRR